MKYSVLGFSQQKAVELGIGIDELIVLRWFVDFSGTSKMKTEFIDGKVFYWVNYQTIVDSLPVLRLKKQALRKKVFKNLCDAEVLIHKTIKIGGIFSYYAYGLNYEKLIYLEDGEVQNPETKGINVPKGGYKRTQGLGINVPNKDSSIKDSSINDNHICPPSVDECDSPPKKPKSDYYKNTPHEVLKEDGTNDKSAISFVNFELIYAEYPKKVGKQKAFQHYVNLRLGVKKTSTGTVKLSNKEIFDAMIKYLEEKGDTEIQYLNQFDVFLNTKIYDYLEE